MPKKIRVVIADYQPLFRQGVVHAFETSPDLDIAGEGATAEEAVQLAQRLLPDIVLLDLAVPGDALSAARTISASCPDSKIVMLSDSEAEQDVLSALRAGARAYALKAVSAQDLASIVRAVHAGQVYVTPTLAASVLLQRTGTGSGPRPLNGPLEELTDREREILSLVAAGLSNKEIGWQLHLTEKTVKHYMTNILQKLQVRNRVQAALLAQGFGRVDSAEG